MLSGVLNTKKNDYLKEGLLEFLQKEPKTLDECVIEGGNLMKQNGFKGSAKSDDFRMRIFEKLHQLTASGKLTKDKTVKPPVFKATPRKKKP